MMEAVVAHLGSWVDGGKAAARVLLGRCHLEALGLRDVLGAVALGSFGRVAWVLWKARPPQLMYYSEDPQVMMSLRDIAHIWTAEGESERRRLELRRLSVFWRNPDVAAEAQPDPELTDEGLIKFFEKHVRSAPYFRGAYVQRYVVCQLLELLDREGDTPSVVRMRSMTKGTDWDSQLSDGTFGALARVPLREHALGTAVSIIDLLTTQGSRHIIPDALIAALGHDLGKLPSRRTDLYATADHALASASVLTGLEGFAQLAHKDEILRAVKLHHRESEERLAKLLRDADHGSRKLEFEDAKKRVRTLADPADQVAPPSVAEGRMISARARKAERAAASGAAEADGTRGSGGAGPSGAAGGVVESPAAAGAEEPENGGPTSSPVRWPDDAEGRVLIPVKGMPVPTIVVPEEDGEELAAATSSADTRSAPVAQPTGAVPPMADAQREAAIVGDADAAWRDEALLFGTGTESRMPRPADIGEWFNLDLLLGALAKRINRPGKRRVDHSPYAVFSLRARQVFVQLAALEQAVREVAAAAPAMVPAGVGKGADEVRAVLAAVLRRLDQEGVTEEGHRPEGRLAGRWEIRFRGNARRVEWMVVLRIEAFERWGVPSDLESRKNSQLRRIVDVVPAACGSQVPENDLV